MSSGFLRVFVFRCVVALRGSSVTTLTIRSFAIIINLSASSIVYCMAVITSLLALCGLVTNHRTSQVCTGGSGGGLPWGRDTW